MGQPIRLVIEESSTVTRLIVVKLVGNHQRALTERIDDGPQPHVKIGHELTPRICRPRRVGAANRSV